MQPAGWRNPEICAGEPHRSRYIVPEAGSDVRRCASFFSDTAICRTLCLLPFYQQTSLLSVIENTVFPRTI
jgi:hypothetical protein